MGGGLSGGAVSCWKYHPGDVFPPHSSGVNPRNSRPLQLLTIIVRPPDIGLSPRFSPLEPHGRGGRSGAVAAATPSDWRRAAVLHSFDL